MKCQDSVRNVVLNQCLFFCFIYNNKLWTVFSLKQNVIKFCKICKNLLLKVGQDLCLCIKKFTSKIVKKYLRRWWGIYSRGYWTQSFSLSKCTLNVNKYHCVVPWTATPYIFLFFADPCEILIKSSRNY